MFPFSDNLTRGGWPVGVTLMIGALAIANIPLFVLPDLQSDAIRLGGFVPLLFSTQPFSSIYRMMTATALHGDIFHLAGNCLFLAVFGRSLERLFGTKLFLLIFPVLGIAGLLAEWAIHADSSSPVIGASGAIAALMGAYLALFPGAKIRMIVFLGWFWKRFTLPSWAFLPYWMSIQMASILLGAQDGVAYAVHAGSFALGAIAAVIWKTSFMGAEEELESFNHKSFS